MGARIQHVPLFLVAVIAGRIGLPFQNRNKLQKKLSAGRPPAPWG
ncbi:hypothetical protein B005_3132 [Nocardiopsis alba ATCC BAA-2165]|uniref:Uncharacterized protein n=1 Tax=Nocardiopsis alba (strain ATCC BAA-2165 / BE74) TaxID=1205910 RepID=J7L4N9_NOCAA|nr:hypothetical protein B005_3132 [Nocardiopsis alba ATCC BAA-2165]